MAEDHSEETALLAGEYALGTLSWDERMAFEALLKNNPALQTEVDFWQRELAGMLGTVAPKAAPQVLDRIQATLFGQPAQVRPRFAAALPLPSGLGYLGLLALAVATALVIKGVALLHLLD
jgi:anti-sigma-K factor RskA